MDEENVVRITDSIDIEDSFIAASATAVKRVNDLLKNKVVDAAFSETSENPVQNKVVAQAIKNIPSTVFDSIIMRDQVNGFNYIVCMREGNLVSYSPISKFTVVSLPTKTTYMHGSAIDPTGMVIEAQCVDGSTREIKNYEFTGYALHDDYYGYESGEYECNCTISYKENGVEYNIQVAIMITITPFNAEALLGNDFTYIDYGDSCYISELIDENVTEITIPDNVFILI